jgi:hypothetical protein
MVSIMVIMNVPAKLISSPSHFYEVTGEITQQAPFQSNVTGTIGCDVAPRGGHMAQVKNGNVYVLTFTVTVTLTEAFELLKVFARNADLSAEFTLVEVQLK